MVKIDAGGFLAVPVRVICERSVKFPGHAGSEASSMVASQGTSAWNVFRTIISERDTPIGGPLSLWPDATAFRLGIVPDRECRILLLPSHAE